MDPKKQAEQLYKSLSTVDALSCKLMRRKARANHGRIASLQRKLLDLQKNKAPAEQIKLVEKEISQRKELAAMLASLDKTIDKAIEKRKGMDVNKWK